MKVNADNNTAGSLGVGAVAGAIAGYENGQFTEVSAGKVSGLSVEGKIEASLPDTVQEDQAYGIGGIVGYAKLENKAGAVKIEECKNHADISGNMSTGGIVGRIDGTLNYKAGTVYNAARLKAEANILNCTSDGLILCTTEENDSSTTKGNYFGGITGYSDHALIYKASSASGRAGNFTYNKKKRICFWGLMWEESPVTVITHYCPIVLRKRTDTFSVKIMSAALPADSEKECPKRSSHPQMQAPA